MKFKQKRDKQKLFLFTSALGALVSFTFFSAACERKVNSRFDQVEDGIVKIASSFEQNGFQGKALQQIVDVYNLKLQKENSNNNKPLKFQIVNIPGYKNTDDALNKELVAKNKSTLWNLMLNYSYVASTLAKNNMQLNFAPADGTKVDVSNYDPNFLKVNKNIPKLNSNGLWVIPIVKSTFVLSFNGVVFSYILNLLLAQNNDQNSKAQIIIKKEDQDFFNKIINLKISDQQIEYVKKLWGSYKAILVSQGGLEGFELSKNTFGSLMNILDFASRVEKSFPDIQTKNSKVEAVFAIDYPARNTFQAVMSKNGGDESKFLVKKNIVVEKETNNQEHKTTTWDYKTLLNDPQSEQQKQLKSIYSAVAPYLVGKAVRIRPGGNQYGSSYMKTNRILMQLATTAGYNYNFQKEGIITRKVTVPNLDFQFSADTDKRLLLKTNNDPNNDYVAQIITPSVNDDKIFIYPSNALASKIKKGSFQSTSLELDNLLKSSANGVLVEKSKIKTKKSLDQYQNKTFNLKNVDTKQVKEFVYFAQDELIIDEIGSEKTITESQFIAIEQPTKFFENDPINVIPVTGINFVGVHANKIEDEATRKFVNWAINEKTNFTFKNKEYKNVTAVEFFGKINPSVIPTK